MLEECPCHREDIDQETRQLVLASAHDWTGDKTVEQSRYRHLSSMKPASVDVNLTELKPEWHYNEFYHSVKDVVCSKSQRNDTQRHQK